MVQRRGGAGLAPEALEGLGILGEVLGKKLEGDEAAEQRVFGFVDHTHATAAEKLNDPVMGDGCADHVQVKTKSAWNRVYRAHRQRSNLRANESGSQWRADAKKTSVVCRAGL